VRRRRHGRRRSVRDLLSNPTGSVGPLDDITVVEVANWVAAPSCGALMADMGARVIKVEPPAGDSMRGRLRQPTLPDDAPKTDYPFHLDNRGKRSLAVDLGNPRGQDLVRELVVRADVFITNLLPGRLAKYRLAADELCALHPGLVYGLVTGYGSAGPDADRIGFDLTAFFARSGIMSLVGEPDDPPPMFRPGQGDHPTGLALLSAVLAALRVRDRTGKGQVVETALMRTAAWSIACDVAVALVDRKQPTKRGRGDAMSPMNTTYRCSDGTWLNLAALDQTAWARFCAAIGRDDLAADERFTTPVDRFRNRHEVISILEQEFGSKPYEHWVPRLDAAGIIWGKVATLDELVDDLQAEANGMFATIDHSVAGPFETLEAPFVMSESMVEVRGPGPEAPGEHSSQVLRDMGFDDERITELTAAGIISDNSR
jgi:crotonobetainyl-CoA:carnitine CoA-transferase CaiB-like acyl-CoA transferase